ncbi:hypothetical protein C9I43_09925 [Shewanella morhuae]|uniref:Uncharacterized protein n=1 Tax=Shewanella morhuae TaxID=365591 RepID=A0A380A8E2_9GAMM|nr:hypothetical protein [Shewanella morhuae]PTA50802.1 hypothetical protein C9I43_09925 [Shewanella morhuae]SUI75964.1 Uncharacterised protein [Shewanella morhuae]
MSNKATDELVMKLITTASKFRLGHEADGSHDFAHCIDQLKPLLPELTNAMTVVQLFREMLAAQERHDWLALADSLEYDLPLLLNVSFNT